MTDLAAPAAPALPSAAPLDDAEIRGFLRGIPGIAAVPVVAMLADSLAPEVVIPASLALFGIEQLYRNGMLEAGLDKLVDRGMLKPENRDKVLDLVGKVDQAMPLRPVDVALLAALAPELKALEPLAAKLPFLRPVAAAVRVMASVPVKAGHALAEVAGRAL